MNYISKRHVDEMRRIRGKGGNTLKEKMHSELSHEKLKRCFNADEGILEMFCTCTVEINTCSLWVQGAARSRDRS